MKRSTLWPMGSTSRLAWMRQHRPHWPSLGRAPRATWFERQRPHVVQVGTATAAGTAGALGALLLDPRSGRRRRRRIKDRGLALARRGVRAPGRGGRLLRSRLAGKVAAATHRRDRTTDYDDVTLAHKVETKLGRYATVPKGQFNVDACDGVVTLRGEIADPDTIAEIVAHVRDVQGVHGIANLLHLPGTLPPNLNGQFQHSGVEHGTG
jgi:BON domain